MLTVLGMVIGSWPNSYVSRNADSRQNVERRPGDSSGAISLQQDLVSMLREVVFYLLLRPSHALEFCYLREAMRGR